MLAATGLLDGRRATTHWLGAGHLAECSPATDVDPNTLFVDEGRIITSAGASAGLDWDTLGPMIARVMQTGEANWTPALPLLMEGAGYREEASFSVSHAPAEDDQGRIAGMPAVWSA